MIHVSCNFHFKVRNPFLKFSLSMMLCWLNILKINIGWNCYICLNTDHKLSNVREVFTWIKHEIDFSSVLKKEKHYFDESTYCDRLQTEVCWRQGFIQDKKMFLQGKLAIILALLNHDKIVSGFGEYFECFLETFIDSKLFCSYLWNILSKWWIHEWWIC